MRWWRGAASPPDERVVQRREREEPERQRRIGVEPTRSKTTSGRPQIGARYSAPAPVKTSIRPAVTEFVRRRDTAVDGIGRRIHSSRPGAVATMLLRLEQPPADQFAFPEPIAAGVEAVGGLPFDGELKHSLSSTHGIASPVAGVSYAVAAPDVLRVFARQGASVEFLANPIDQRGIPGAHSKNLTLTPAGPRGHMSVDPRRYTQDVRRGLAGCRKVWHS